MNLGKKRRASNSKWVEKEAPIANIQDETTERPRNTLEVEMENSSQPNRSLGTDFDLLIKESKPIKSREQWQPVSKQALLSNKDDSGVLNGEIGNLKTKQAPSKKKKKPKRDKKKGTSSLRKGSQNIRRNNKRQKTQELRLNVMRRKPSGTSAASIYPQVSTPLGGKIKRTNFLRLNNKGGRVSKPVKVRYSVTTKHNPRVELFSNRRDVFDSQNQSSKDRRHFNSVDLMGDDAGSISGHAFFKRKKSRRGAESAKKKGIKRQSAFKETKTQVDGSGAFIFGRRNTLTLKNRNFDEGHNFFHTNLAKKRKFRGTRDRLSAAGVRAYEAVLGGQVFRKEKGKGRALLEEIGGRQGIGEVLSLKGLENAYFETIYQKLNKKIGVKGENKKRRGKKRKSSGKIVKSKILYFNSNFCLKNFI